MAAPIINYELKKRGQNYLLNFLLFGRNLKRFETLN